MRKTLLLFAICLAWMEAPLLAQQNTVPFVPAGTITIDGMADEAFWDTGLGINLLTNTDWWAAAFPDVDVEEATAQVLYTTDTLFVFVFIDENELFFQEGNPWGSDQILIGVDATNAGAEVDEDFAGWPQNAPDLGPTSYIINPEGRIWQQGSDQVDPQAEGWAIVQTFVDEDNALWGAEIALVLDQVEPGAEIGFNIGGATASEAANADPDVGFPYGWFSWGANEFPGGDINHDASTYQTLRMAGGGEGYGINETVEVPYADPATMVMDGVADEAAWEDAQEANIVANWSFYGEQDPPISEPDFLETTTKLLWSQDTLYVYVALRGDPELFSCCEEGSWWSSDMILVGLDNSFAGDSLFGPNFDGGIGNAPEGPHTYFITPPAGFTIGWNLEIIPEEMGWVNGTVFSGEDPDFGDFMWGIEAAFYVPNIEDDAQIGFDIGGAQASQFQCDATEGDYCDYAYFAWKSGTGGVDPGNINRDASQWVTLKMVQELGTGIEIRPGDELPNGFTLEQNYPNPFNPTTTIEYGVQRAGHVSLAVFNTLGQQVATLIDGVQQTGTYRVQWQADDLSSGVYLYRLQVDGQIVAMKKMMLMK